MSRCTLLLAVVLLSCSARPSTRTTAQQFLRNLGVPAEHISCEEGGSCSGGPFSCTVKTSTGELAEISCIPWSGGCRGTTPNDLLVLQRSVSSGGPP